MKYGQFIVGLLVGAVGMHFLHKRGYMSNNPKSTEEIIVDVKQEEMKKYSEPLKKKYDIVLTPNKYTKRVLEKKEQLTRGRYEVDLNKVKEPVSI